MKTLVSAAGSLQEGVASLGSSQEDAALLSHEKIMLGSSPCLHRLFSASWLPCSNIGSGWCDISCDADGPASSLFLVSTLCNIRESMLTMKESCWS